MRLLVLLILLVLAVPAAACPPGLRSRFDLQFQFNNQQSFNYGNGYSNGYGYSPGSSQFSAQFDVEQRRRFFRPFQRSSFQLNGYNSPGSFGYGGGFPRSFGGFSN
jgi:hypothetical protein